MRVICKLCAEGEKKKTSDTEIPAGSPRGPEEKGDPGKRKRGIRIMQAQKETQILDGRCSSSKIIGRPMRMTTTTRTVGKTTKYYQQHGNMKSDNTKGGKEQSRQRSDRQPMTRSLGSSSAATPTAIALASVDSILLPAVQPIRTSQVDKGKYGPPVLCPVLCPLPLPSLPVCPSYRRGASSLAACPPASLSQRQPDTHQTTKSCSGLTGSLSS
ncbi:uncharacterized protein PG998_008026 [Apiospora kogelbergensis]|uniref:uncharacterized protein n=1 Tax=Apiospora kogelbergensis TaxID=1337665 RepID=UPI00312EEF35